MTRKQQSCQLLVSSFGKVSTKTKQKALTSYRQHKTELEIGKEGEDDIVNKWQ